MVAIMEYKDALAHREAGDDWAHVVDVREINSGIYAFDARVLRMAGPGAFEDDPLRVVRVARLALVLGFAIDPATRAAAGRFRPLRAGSA